MWRKLFLVFALLMVSVSPVSAQDKTYSAEKFDVAIAIQEDGSILVTETVTFLFVGEPFTFVFRDLEGDLSDGIVNLEARVDGDLLREGTDPGEVEVSYDGDDVDVTWHLEPTANTSKTFTLSYQMLGVMRQDEGSDRFRYQPLPDEFEYEVGSSTVTVTFPNTAVLLEEPRADEGALIEQFGNQVITTQSNFDDGDVTTITLLFESGSVIETAPLWQQNRQRQNALGPLWMVSSGLVFILGIFGITLAERRFRMPQTKTAVSQYGPPSDLPPAMAGVLNGINVEPVWVNAMATLFDLADRGAIAIEETEDKKWHQKHEFVVHLLKRPSGLRPHENGLLDMLFNDKGKSVDSFKLSKLTQKLMGKNWNLYKDPLKEELDIYGYLSQERRQLRNRFFAGGAVLLALGVISFILTAIFEYQFGLWPFIPAFVFMLLSAGVFIVGSTIKPLSPKGLAEASEWQRFFEHLKAVSQDKASTGKVNAFQAYLPYAVSYGLMSNWVKWYEKQGGTELPHYFKVLSATPEAGFAAFVAMSNSTAATASGGAAGGGAAGGGASGAG